MTADIYGREKILLGEEGFQALRAAKVAVCGLGGVGSYAAETLARSGVGTLILLDFDTITASNINRQLYALHSTLGKDKADVAAARIADIDPTCLVQIKKAYIDQENPATFLGKVDYIVDAIDFLPGKVGLIQYAHEANIPIICAMGAGKRLAPEKLEIADISRTHICPLAKKLRKELKAVGIDQGVDVVFSTEQPLTQKDNSAIGSMAFVPAAMGIIMASWVVRKLAGKA